MAGAKHPVPLKVESPRKQKVDSLFSSVVLARLLSSKQKVRSPSTVTAGGLLQLRSLESRFPPQSWAFPDRRLPTAPCRHCASCPENLFGVLTEQLRCGQVLTRPPACRQIWHRVLLSLSFPISEVRVEQPP